MDSGFKLFKDIDFVEQETINTYKKQIIEHLKVLKINENATSKMLDAIDKMPASTHLLGAVQFLTELTDKKSVCENYYAHSDYIAEYFCTLSNLGFFAVAFYYRDYAALFVATFSALSHAIPLKRLNDLDKIAAVTAFIIIISHYNLITKNPAIAASGVVTFSIGALDFFIGRKYKDSLGPLFHSAWHLAAAYAMYQFNHGKVDVSASDLSAISQSISQNVVPGFLQISYDAIGESLAAFSNPGNKCGIC